MGTDVVTQIISTFILVISFIAGGGAFLYSMKGQIAVILERMTSFQGVVTSLQKQLEKLDAELQRMAEVLLKQAVQDERLTALDQRVNLLAQRLDASIQNKQGRATRSR